MLSFTLIKFKELINTDRLNKYEESQMPRNVVGFIQYRPYKSHLPLNNKTNCFLKTWITYPEDHVHRS